MFGGRKKKLLLLLNMCLYFTAEIFQAGVVALYRNKRPLVRVAPLPSASLLIIIRKLRPCVRYSNLSKHDDDDGSIVAGSPWEEFFLARW